MKSDDSCHLNQTDREPSPPHQGTIQPGRFYYFTNSRFISRGHWELGDVTKHGLGLLLLANKRTMMEKM